MIEFGELEGIGKEEVVVYFHILLLHSESTENQGKRTA
jgi:hypothetical protein